MLLHHLTNHLRRRLIVILHKWTKLLLTFSCIALPLSAKAIKWDWVGLSIGAQSLATKVNNPIVVSSPIIEFVYITQVNKEYRNKISYSTGSQRLTKGLTRTDASVHYLKYAYQQPLKINRGLDIWYGFGLGVVLTSLSNTTIVDSNNNITQRLDNRFNINPLLNLESTLNYRLAHRYAIALNTSAGFGNDTRLAFNIGLRYLF